MALFLYRMVSVSVRVPVFGVDKPVQAANWTVLLCLMLESKSILHLVAVSTNTSGVSVYRHAIMTVVLFPMPLMSFIR